MKIRRLFHGDIFVLACLMASALLQVSAEAMTYYAAKTGRNSHTCTQARNPAAAKLTIAAGLQCLAGGDTLTIQAGTYNEWISSNNIPNGSAAGHTVIQGAAGEIVWIRPTTENRRPTPIINFEPGAHHITLRGFGVDGSGVANLPREIGAITAQQHSGVAGHNMIWENLEVKNFHGPSADAFIIERYSYNIVVRNSYIHDILDNSPGTTPNNAFYIQGSEGGVIIEKNRIENCGSGINLRNSNNGPLRDIIVRGNTLINISATAISVEVNATNALLYNNIIAHANRGIRYNGTNTRVYHNTVYDASPYDGIVRFDKRPFTSTQARLIKNNIFFRVSGDVPSGNFTDDPLFINPANADFRLKASSSAIDSGVILADALEDFAGVPRFRGDGPDFGAFEFISDSSDSRPFRPANLRLRICAC